MNSPRFLRTLRFAFAALALMLFASPAMSQAPAKCAVLDPELQGGYSGGCKDGLAEGYGEASGAAEYKGSFRAGRKHGRGVKTWPTGDRYEGDFIDDRKDGVGTYVWGPRSAWAGEKYAGNYRNDRRHGFGVYEWPGGDRYSGPWENDAITGRATPMMMARARAYAELAAAVGKPGAKVCRDMTVGISTHDWVRGTVMEVKEGQLKVRIDDAGQFQHLIANLAISKNYTIWDALQSWTPCR